MVKSMTGFGMGTMENEAKKITVEIKTVNNRYLEVIARMPKSLNPLEDRIKKMVGTAISRGRVELFITLEESEGSSQNVFLDEALAQEYYVKLKRLADICGMDDSKIDLSRLAGMPGVFSLERPEDDLEALWQLLAAALEQALAGLVEMRSVEGTKLADDLLARRLTVLNCLAKIEDRAPLVVDDYRKRLKQRIDELCDAGCVFDDGRLEAEVAMFADRASITEEIIRLNSHLQQLQNMLKCDNVTGRKLDFLLQELNREINTIGSKANDLTISDLVIEVKAEFEKIREQVQNIE